VPQRLYDPATIDRAASASARQSLVANSIVRFATSRPGKAIVSSGADGRR
jgi:hypothetical protein